MRAVGWGVGSVNIIEMGGKWGKFGGSIEDESFFICRLD